ncbi:MAG: hypothetical protein NVSMB42_13980 [Herpetosiphon sp.]
MHVGERPKPTERIAADAARPGSTFSGADRAHAAGLAPAVVPVRWQRVVRVVWIAISILYVALFLAAIPPLYAQLSSLAAIGRAWHTRLGVSPGQ